MTIIKVESFDLTGTTVADLQLRGYNALSGITISTTAGKFGGGSILCSSSSVGLTWSPIAFASYVTISEWIKTPTVLGTTNFITCTDKIGDLTSSSADYNFAAGYNSNGSWKLLGDSGALRATSASGLIAADTWYHIELRVNIASAGNGTLYIDGIQMLDAAGDYLETNAIPTFFFLGEAGIVSHDDVVIQTDGSALPALLGVHKIHTLLPDADTAQADWTGASTDVDDPAGTTHDGDTTFISTATLNAKSEFAVANLAESPTTIHAVQTTLVSRKTDAGAKAVTPYLVSNATRGDGAEFNTADGTYVYSSDVFVLDPDGSVAWTETSVNAVLFGVEITT